MVDVKIVFLCPFCTDFHEMRMVVPDVQSAVNKFAEYMRESLVDADLESVAVPFLVQELDSEDAQ